MIIECTNCHSKYQYDEQRFEGKPSKKIKCARCQQVFEVFNPGLSDGGAPSAASSSQDRMQGATRHHEEPGDRTGIRRERPKTVVDEPIPDLPAQSAAAAQTPLRLPVGKRLSLAIIDGPDAGSVFRLEKPRVTIGRQGADLNLKDSDASRQHAAVEVRDMAFTLLDLQSTNGTLVEGQKIDDSVELQNQSEFQIGSSTLMLIVTDDT